MATTPHDYKLPPPPMGKYHNPDAGADSRKKMQAPPRQPPHYSRSRHEAKFIYVPSVSDPNKHAADDTSRANTFKAPGGIPMEAYQSDTDYSSYSSGSESEGRRPLLSFRAAKVATSRPDRKTHRRDRRHTGGNGSHLLGKDPESMARHPPQSGRQKPRYNPSPSGGPVFTPPPGTPAGPNGQGPPMWNGVHAKTEWGLPSARGARLVHARHPPSSKYSTPEGQPAWGGRR